MGVEAIAFPLTEQHLKASFPRTRVGHAVQEAVGEAAKSLGHQPHLKTYVKNFHPKENEVQQDLHNALAAYIRQGHGEVHTDKNYAKAYRTAYKTMIEAYARYQYASALQHALSQQHSNVSASVMHANQSALGILHNAFKHALSEANTQGNHYYMQHISSHGHDETSGGGNGKGRCTR